MSRHAAFLRAINLGRHRKVSSAELRAGFEELGFDDVATFRTSGNVVFAADRAASAGMAERIGRRFTQSLGSDVVVFLRSEREVGAIAAHQPFAPRLLAASGGKLQVALLGAKPPAATVRTVLDLATAEDRLAFGLRELYWLPSGGMLESQLNLRPIEKLIGPWTMRTKGTIEQLVAKYFAS